MIQSLLLREYGVGRDLAIDAYMKLLIRVGRSEIPTLSGDIFEGLTMETGTPDPFNAIGLGIKFANSGRLDKLKMFIVPAYRLLPFHR